MPYQFKAGPRLWGLDLVDELNVGADLLAQIPSGHHIHLRNLAPRDEREEDGVSQTIVFSTRRRLP